MSAQMIARWNAIPLERGDAASPSLKRPRPDEEDDDDDDMSLVSRSPSPPADDAMDVDGTNIHGYDEYVRRPVREVITVDTKIKPSNKGFALLSKLGWVEGQPVGLSGDGRVDPVPFSVKSDLTGLGKTTQDFKVIEETVSQRRELDSERQRRENEEQRRQREDAVAKKVALESEISSTLRAFYCSLCDKQFKNVAQYDEHTNSYAHHHKARFKDMQANVRIKPQEEIDKRKEKERKREEKELRKIAAASGIKIPKPAAAVSGSSPAAVLAPVLPPEMDGKPAEVKKSGWASISSSQGGSSSSSGGFTKSGWATVGSSSTASSSRFAQPSPPPPPSAPPTASNPSTSHSGYATQSAGHLPTFRNAGWTSLDTGSSQPPPPAEEPPRPPPASASTRGGWASIGSSSSLARATPPPPPPPSEPASLPGPPPPPPPSHLPPQPVATPPPENKPVRSNWQQFKRGIGKRR
ncbi:hypothetical protein CVT26_009355 [Gymnopilus dilepis]|uniref:G-patch domain-containing protein n=1 Tax=Gymnopilus dilepis TaxID=231916 RepID=A0A409WCF3_9AGAR|nr:hypothetical protein CVT26_009355 [Gymnopilus dilepis]